jgi:hypothetical protein
LQDRAAAPEHRAGAAGVRGVCDLHDGRRAAVAFFVPGVFDDLPGNESREVGQKLQFELLEKREEPAKPARNLQTRLRLPVEKRAE